MADRAHASGLARIAVAMGFSSPQGRCVVISRHSKMAKHNRARRETFPACPEMIISTDTDCLGDRHDDAD